VSQQQETCCNTFLGKMYYIDSLAFKELAMSLTVRLDEQTETQLQRYCQAQDVSKSQVVHLALKQWLGQQHMLGHAMLSFAATASRQAEKVPADHLPASYTAYSKQALRNKLDAKASKP
jgi:hypothetical protein